jgi:hypothetical protein
VIHQTDPNAKTVFGGLAGADEDFAKRALDACGCASEIDIFAYHNYPGYGHNLNPEAVHAHADTNPSSKPLREMVRSYPGIRKELVFWDDEFNDGIPSWAGSDETVQAKYIPRGLVTDRAAGIRTFVWLIVGATDGNELDDFGMLHGLLYRADDFTERPAYRALQNANTLFSDTQPDASIKVKAETASAGRPVTHAFRSAKGNAIVAYWLPVLSKPGVDFPMDKVTLRIVNSGVQNPVLVDVTSGKLTALTWKRGAESTLEDLPLRDSVMAIADRSYFDWPELPEAPSDLSAKRVSAGADLTFSVHGGNPEFISVERRNGIKGEWRPIAQLPGNSTSFADRAGSNAEGISYRVRARNSAGVSAYSNIATVTQ